jgi:hypothetical protein
MLADNRIDRSFVHLHDILDFDAEHRAFDGVGTYIGHRTRRRVRPGAGKG